MVNIALIGFGNVGRAFAGYLLKQPGDPRCRIAALADVSGGFQLESPAELSSLSQDTNRGALLADLISPSRLMEVPAFIRSLPNAGIGTLVECMPTNIVDGRPALDYLRSALQLGISAVTVDKGPIVHGFRELSDTAQRAGVALAYTGTTGVRPPHQIQRRQVSEIRGVLNGTTNFILSRMLEESMPFAEALREAQEQGIAEPDPTLDVEGWDTASKILILANRWMNAAASLPSVARKGIGPHTEPLVREARSRKSVLRLVGSALTIAGTVRISVAPEFIDRESPFFEISGTSKGASFRTTDGGEFFVAARSGRDEIARTILEDVLLVASGTR